VEVRIAGDALVYSDPNLVYLAWWEPNVGVWVPYHTEWDSAAGEFVATVDHFGTVKYWEWTAWEDLAAGTTWTGHQVKALATGGERFATDTSLTVAAGLNMISTDAAGWLGLRGASMPTCGDATGFRLEESATSNQRPVFACIEAENAFQARVKLANNRPYGMVATVPDGAEVVLETWAGHGIDSGQTGASTFFELLESVGVNQTYVPPGTTVVVTVDLEASTMAVIDLTSTPTYVGLDLAAELLKAIWLESSGAAANSVACLLSTGSSLLDIADTYDPETTLVFLDKVGACVVRQGPELAGLVYDIAKASLSTIPSLPWDLKYTNLTRFEVRNSLRVTRAAMSPGWEAIANAEVPAMCSHEATRLVNGTDESIPEGHGDFGLHKTLYSGEPGYAVGLQSESGVLTAVVAGCNAGGVGWPHQLLFFDLNGQFVATTDFAEFDWYKLGLDGPARNGIRSLQVVDNLLVVELFAFAPDDGRCCPSALTTAQVAVTTEGVSIKGIVLVDKDYGTGSHQTDNSRPR
jgi:hypothetical protein